MQDPYKTLGIAQNASEDEIKKAYRILAKKYHPDVNKDPGAEDRFIEVQNAYQAIMDARKRGDRGNFWEHSGSNAGYDGYGGFHGFGGFQDFGQQSYQNTSGMNDFQTIVNLINSQRFMEANQILQGMRDRGADWYYLSAIAQYGMGNQIAAMDLAEKACQMDPSNQQYRQFYAQIQSGRSRYRNMQQPFSMGGNDLCCRLVLCSMCLNGCCGGGYYCC